MNSARRTAALPAVGFPIRTSPDQSLVSGSPTLFAATHVLLRLLSPRHPSCALCSLVISLLRPTPLPGLQSRRPGSSAVQVNYTSPSHRHLLAYLRICDCQRTLPPGGADRDRTDDIQLAKLALSQLSYGPGHSPGDTNRGCRRIIISPTGRGVARVVGLDRFELSTPRLSSVCSNQLSYRPHPGRKRAPRIPENHWLSPGPSKPDSKPTI